MEGADPMAKGMATQGETAVGRPGRRTRSGPIGVFGPPGLGVLGNVLGKMIQIASRAPMARLLKGLQKTDRLAEEALLRLQIVKGLPAAALHGFRGGADAAWRSQIDPSVSMSLFGVSASIQ